MTSDDTICRVYGFDKIEDKYECKWMCWREKDYSEEVYQDYKATQDNIRAVKHRKV